MKKLCLLMALILTLPSATFCQKSWIDLINQGIELNKQEALDSAEIIFIAALDRAKKDFGKAHSNYGTSCYWAGYSAYRLGFFYKAEPYLLEACDVFSVSIKKESFEYARAANILGLVYASIVRYTDADTRLSEALTIFGKVAGKDHAEYTTCLNDVANFYFSLANYAKAEPLFLELKEIDARVLGREHATYANDLNMLAALYKETKNYVRAEELYLEIMELDSKLYGKSHAYYADDLTNLASVYEAMGNKSKALPLQIEAKEIRVQATGKNDPKYLNNLYDLADYYSQGGNFTKAETFLLKAKEFKEGTTGRQDYDYATVLNKLSTLYSDLGNYKKALHLLLEAVEIDKKTIGTESIDYSYTLNNLGLLYYQMGEYSKAEPLFQEALQIKLKIVGENDASYSVTLNNLALVYHSQGKYKQAEPLYIRANEIDGLVHGKKSDVYANSLANLASLYWKMLNLKKAEPLLIEALKIKEKTVGKGHPSYITFNTNLASLYRFMKAPERAEPYYHEVIEAIQKQLNLVFPGLSEKEKQNYYASYRYVFSDYERFCLDNYNTSPALASALYNVRLATKGLLLNSTVKTQERISASNDQQLINIYNNWKKKRDYLAKVYQMPSQTKLENGIDEKKLEDEVNSLEKQLSAQSELFASTVNAKQLNWEDIKAKLKEGEVAIEVVRNSIRLERRSFLAYTFLVVGPQTVGQPDLVILENGYELEWKFRKYYQNAIYQKVRDEISYNQYWKPLAEKLKGIKKVYLSSDGVYNQINLNSLYNPETKKYLIDEIEIQLVTSTNDIITAAKTPNTQLKNATLFGYPNFNNFQPATKFGNRTINPHQPKADEIKLDSATRFFNGEDITELPGTKIEVESIGKLLKSKGINMQHFTYDQANELEVKKVIDPQVLHIATHGFFLSNLPSSDTNERSFAGMETQKIVDNPLLRSGLLFAGVKNVFSKTSSRQDNDEEDGILTAYEAMNLNLGHTDLVVLSACETGLGVATNGEGVYGLQRAFQVAGAKSVLMSLWNVSDEATQKLMTLFYQTWLMGKTPREAFKIAQIEMRKQYQDPYYWGAFVLVGN